MTLDFPRPTDPRRTGSVATGGLFWLFALALLLLPFARERAALDAETVDATRAESDVPFATDVADFEQELELELGPAIRAASDEHYTWTAPALADSGLVDLARLPNGRAAYQRHCIGCHGELGDGAGPAARYLAPRPRNFRKGLFKFKSTASSERPRRSDLLQTITRGLAGSSMPEFALLPGEQLADIVEYVRWLALKGEFEQTMLDIAWEEEELPDAAEVVGIVNARWQDGRLRPVFPGVTEPSADEASVARGRALFNDMARAACVSCHGPEGRGDGPNAEAYHDDWGYPIRPRDLTAGVFRAGSEGADLYRTIAVGITGTPMSSFAGALAPEEIWDLVHFVQSLPATRGAR
jgi:mono/diheme cytochrome c family protein